MDTEFTIGAADAGMRFDVFLTRNLPSWSRSQIQKLIRSGNITVNGEKTSAHHWLKKGDAIKVIFSKERELEKVPALEVVKESPEFVVINKPAGIVVHPDAKHKSGTAVDFLISKYPEIAKVGDDSRRPGIVHRLDKEASGLMVVARTKKSFENLKTQFHDRTIIKEYLILAYGENLPDQGEITTSLSRSKISGKIVARINESDKTKKARTIYRVLERQKNFSLVSVQTKTGRTHQIRVHFHSIGHSVAGDKLYKQKNVKGKSEPPRLFLHAVRLKFYDLLGSPQEFSLTLAKDLQDFWGSLK